MVPTLLTNLSILTDPAQYAAHDELHALVAPAAPEDGPSIGRAYKDFVGRFIRVYLEYREDRRDNGEDDDNDVGFKWRLQVFLGLNEELVVQTIPAAYWSTPEAYLIAALRLSGCVYTPVPDTTKVLAFYTVLDRTSVLRTSWAALGGWVGTVGLGWYAPSFKDIARVAVSYKLGAAGSSCQLGSVHVLREDTNSVIHATEMLLNSTTRSHQPRANAVFTAADDVVYWFCPSQAGMGLPLTPPGDYYRRQSLWARGVFDSWDAYRSRLSRLGVTRDIGMDWPEIRRWREAVDRLRSTPLFPDYSDTTAGSQGATARDRTPTARSTVEIQHTVTSASALDATFPSSPTGSIINVPNDPNERPVLQLRPAIVGLLANKHEPYLALHRHLVEAGSWKHETQHVIGMGPSPTIPAPLWGNPQLYLQAARALGALVSPCCSADATKDILIATSLLRHELYDSGIFVGLVPPAFGVEEKEVRPQWTGSSFPKHKGGYGSKCFWRSRAVHPWPDYVTGWEEIDPAYAYAWAHAPAGTGFWAPHDSRYPEWPLRFEAST